MDERPEPALRPSDPQWIWNGSCWEYRQSLVALFLRPFAGGYTGFASADGRGFSGAIHPDLEDAASEALRLRDYLVTYNVELKYQVLVTPPARRIRPVR